MIEFTLIFLFCIILLIGIFTLAVMIYVARDVRNKRLEGEIGKRMESFDLDAFEEKQNLHFPDELRQLYRNKQFLLRCRFFIPRPDDETTKRLWYIRHFLPPDEQTMQECQAIIAQGYFPFAECGEDEYYALMLSSPQTTGNPVAYFYGENKSEDLEADSLEVFFSRLQDATSPFASSTTNDTK